jgi:hypothetical protein
MSDLVAAKPSQGGLQTGECRTQVVRIALRLDHRQH